MATSNKLQILSLAFRTSYTGSSVRVPQIKAALVAEGNCVPFLVTLLSFLTPWLSVPVLREYENLDCMSETQMSVFGDKLYVWRLYVQYLSSNKCQLPVLVREDLVWHFVVGYNLHATLCHSWDVHCLGDDLGDSSRPNHSKLEPLSSESDAISRKSMPASCIPTSRPFSKGLP
ncbi:hypothetical protein TcasGA2_TC033877 [Tribolium castaneum]|uniref:Uncharacterized protein n=1 Tax=Tribolium castaneum TaxID=7070 RepID=A0A139WFD0_TRICA|nr:hypothetical protein TcasGA2_TC033877 [Tribolium castaneum]